MNKITERKKAVEKLLMSVGEDVTREGLIKTPERVAKMYDEIFGGYSIDPHQFTKATFADDAGIENGPDFKQGMVIVRDIQFYSHCEHHMVPFFGKVHVGYIPGKQVIGLSKIARIVDAFARRLQIQERMGKQIADLLMADLLPQGVIVVIEAQHLCMKMRGVKNPCADTVTSVVRGIFKDQAVRMEFFELLEKH